MNQNKYTASILTDHGPKNTVGTCDWLLPPVYMLWLCLEYTIRPLVVGVITTKSCLTALHVQPVDTELHTVHETQTRTVARVKPTPARTDVCTQNSDLLGLQTV